MLDNLPTNLMGNMQGPVQQGGKEALTAKMDELRSKRGEFNAMNIANKNKLEDNRMEALQEVFDVMLKYGIDPSDINQVTAFINKLEKENPEMYQLFIKAFEELLGEQAQSTPQNMMREGMPQMPEGQPQVLPQGGQQSIGQQFPNLGM